MKKLFKPLLKRIRYAFLILTKYDKFYLVGINFIDETDKIAVDEIGFKMQRDFAYFLTQMHEDEINSELVEEVNLYDNGTND